MLRSAAGLASLALLALPARAHHEAIFGPHSTLVLSAPAFASLQLHTRRAGAAGSRSQETTGLLSAGVNPFSFPLSFTLVVPASHISELDAGKSQTGIEDILVGAKYRLDLEGLQRRFDREGNYLLGMAAIEVPSGTIDHEALHATPGAIAGGVLGVERGALSGIAYGLYHMTGSHHDQDPGDKVFAGMGAAFTPWDDPETERLVSFQLGLSYEVTAKDRMGGATVDDSGGWAALVHPTVAWGPGGHFLLFGFASLPIAQHHPAAADEEGWRLGGGVVKLLDLF